MRNFYLIFHTTILLMAIVVIREIREQYNVYQTLLSERKTISDKVINVSERKKNQRNFYTSPVSNLKHVYFDDPVNLLVEVRVDNHKSFKFQLKYPPLSPTPFFRFDSDGGTHRNYDDDLPFEDQSVDTPHFNYFSSTGLLLAMQTPELKNSQVRNVLIDDINLCLAHFCSEANIRLHEEDFPEVAIMPNLLNLILDKSDPNSGIIFS